MLLSLVDGHLDARSGLSSNEKGWRKTLRWPHRLNNDRRAGVQQGERGCKDDVAIIGASSGAMRPNARLVVVIPPGTWADWNMTRRPKPEKPLHQLHLLLICSHWCEPHIPGSLATQRCSQWFGCEQCKDETIYCSTPWMVDDRKCSHNF